MRKEVRQAVEEIRNQLEEVSFTDGNVLYDVMRI
jgi:hypothetical protein